MNPDRIEQIKLEIIESFQNGDRQRGADLAVKIPFQELDFAPVVKTLAVAYYRQRDYAKSVKFFRKLLQLEPNDHGHFTNLGAALKSNGEADKAIECYKRSLSVDPNQAGVYSNMGNAYKSLKQPENAINAFKKAIEIDDGFGQAYANLANLLIDEERTEEAREWLSIIIEKTA